MSVFETLITEWENAAMDTLRFRIERKCTPWWHFLERRRLWKLEKEAREKAQFYAFMLTEGYH